MEHLGKPALIRLLLLTIALQKYIHVLCHHSSWIMSIIIYHSRTTVAGGTKNNILYIYSKIPLLRPPKIKTNSPLKSIFKKFQSFFLWVFCTQCLLERDHLWDCSKVVLKTSFEQSQRWASYRNFTVYIIQIRISRL